MPSSHSAYSEDWCTGRDQLQGRPSMVVLACHSDGELLSPNQAGGGVNNAGFLDFEKKAAEN